MQGEVKARWLQLCEQAAVEQDPGKLLALVREINDLLSAKQRRLEPFTVADSNNSAPKPVGTRILLVDDSRIVRTALKDFLLQENPAWEIIEAEKGQEAIEKIPELRPALVILDRNLPDIPGHEAAQQIRQLSPATKIAVCSVSDPAHLAVMAQNAGADGYFTKDSSPTEMYKIITSALES